ncbi:hypothetical protein HCJ66_02900 [Listeria sp. FSL L7-1582]|uniref:hypothetical protein n=1 Tax=Listeria portnoyi TaxID=2713504 RepID=UPI00164CE7EE|nr:hypothetical protein [Listeria portnoyi]MBC6308496.1 hypothetical protein [Listeria portnoyi]
MNFRALKKILLVIGILLVGLFAYIGIVWAKGVWPINETSLEHEEIGKLAIGMDKSQIKNYYPEFEIVSEDAYKFPY